MEKLYDLSAPQKSILLTEQFYSGTSINNIGGGIIVHEALDFELFKQAILNFVKYNDSFRIRLKQTASGVKQYFEEFSEFNMDIVDLKSEEEVADLDEKILYQPTNIFEERLFEFTIFRFPNNHGGYVIKMHHLISDAWTSGLLCRKIMHEYANLLNRENDGCNKKFSYTNYLESEENYFASQKFEKDKSYWMEKFKDIPSAVSIPSTKDSSNDFSCEGNRSSFVISQKDMEQITKYCTEHSVSVFNFFMAVLSIYVSKINDVSDFVIGTPILNRSNIAEKNTAGMFINIAPLRICLENQNLFTDFISSIAKDSMGLLRHQKYPYQNILEDLRKQDASIPNLYNLVLSYQITRSNNECNIPYDTRWSFNGCTADDVDIHLFDMDERGILNVAYDYKTSKYNYIDIENMHKRLMHIMKQVLKKEDIEISNIEIVTPEEKHKILVEFNNTAVDYPKDKTVVDLFEEQVKKTPDNIAVVFEDQQLTYRELNEKANQLAWYLLENQISNNSIIGILLNRSIEMIISVLAILKSGNCYIPIDPNYPTERIHYMLKNSHAKLLLSTSKVMQNFKLDTNYTNVNLTYFNSFSKNTNNPQVSIKEDDLAYIIYTSGSTGNPKGVMLTHRGISNLINDCNKTVEYLSHPKYDSIVSVTTISFDIWFFETIISLQKGLKLVIANEDEQMIPRLLDELIKKENIKILQTTPSRMKLLLENISDKSNLKNLKYIILAGEQFPISLAQELKTLGNITLYNGYGPSETTIFSTLTNVTNVKKMTIGKPLNNTQIYILDKYKNLCPIGVTGEICISGNGVGKGYLNNALLTDKNFIANPFDNTSLLYQTGDLGSFNIDGTINCLGRIDHQVKLRGLRIELEEIESSILHIDNIKECIVTKKKSIDYNEFLCCYYTASQNIKNSTIQSILQKKLPYYMVPQFFVKLDTMPHTPNGKVDRKKLPMPTFTNSDIDIKKPRNEFDELLVNLLSTLLHIDKISINQSFFELGGDSLNAINLCIKIYNKLKIQLSVKDIFEHPILSDLSDYIANYEATKTTIEKAKILDCYDASSAQKRIYYASKADGEESTLYNCPGALVFGTIPDIEKLKTCFKTLFERHESLRTYFEIKNDAIVQKIAPNINFKLEIQNSISSNTDYLLKQFIKPFNLAKAPLFRATLVVQNNEKATLLLDMHHSISDGTSISILLEELSKLYNGGALENNSITYTDFSEWEKIHFASSEFKESEKFWLDQFCDEIPILHMPSTFQRPVTQSFEGNSYHFEIDKKLKNKITKLSKDLGITPYMFLLASYYVLLYKYTNQEDIIVGTPITGRNLPELSNIFGMFVNSLPLRANIKSNISFKTFLNNIKKTCLDAFEHQDYPFDFLVNKLNLQRNTNRSPLFDTMFIYQNMGAPTLNFKNIQTTFVEAQNHISKFDFSLEIVPNKENFALRLEYCTKLFDANFIENLANRYLKILSTVTNDITTKIANIEMISEEEKNQILCGFNDTKVPYDSPKNLQTIFEENVEKNPDKTAIIFENEKMSYQELNQKVNQLANYLLSNHIKPNDIIGIMLPRSMETIICLLGVLKAGAGYMLIDTSLPKDRIEFMLKNAKSSLFITESKQKKVDFENTVFINKENLNYYNVQNPDINSKITDTLSVVYTSGSTGTPKGIQLHRQGMLNLMESYKKILHTDTYENFLSTCAVSFDMFAVEVFSSFYNGKTLILANDEETKIPTMMSNLIKQYQVEFMLITPSKLQLLLMQKNTAECLSHLKSIQLGGEALTQQLYQEILKYTSANIYNQYGPSEITACCCLKKVDTAINIGSPLCNTQIYLLDKDLNLCPIGIEGEICIAGDGVSNGYINQPELSKKSFIKNPFGNGMLYQSGDIGKWTKNGEIEYIGRKDFQIKIRGLRVELSEIENKFLEIPEIDNSAVIYKQDENDNYLVGFFTSTADIDIADIRQELTKSLPLYMIPKYIIKLDQMPITANGKINKKDLDKHKITKTEKQTYVAPKNDFQALLCDTWNQFLHTQIGIDDNVFECGVDSLIAIKFKTALLSHNINIPYANLFKYPTVRALSENTKLEKSTSRLDNFDYTKINKILQKNNLQTLKDANITHNYKNNILLLGSNGFVGSHILYNFIKQDSGKAYCIIRDKNNKSARNRLIDTLHFYFENELDNFMDDRIIILKGDITKENFGLEKEIFDEITQKISTVINTAAMVKHYGDIKKFKSVNIKLTEKLCEYCKINRKKLLHTSTMSVSESSNIDATYVASKKYENTEFSESNLYIGQMLDNSYTSSKFEAERIILSNMVDGLNAKIIRLGNITNRFSDGTFQINPDENAFANRLKSFIHLKNIPDYLQALPLEFTPVDLCAKAIIYILQNNIKEFSVYHLYNNHSIYLKDFVAILNAENIKLEFIETKRFKSMIKKILDNPESQNDLSGIINDLNENYDLIYERDVNLNSSLTQFFLQRLGFEWPKLDENYIRKYINYMKKINFFKEDI